MNSRQTPRKPNEPADGNSLARAGDDFTGSSTRDAEFEQLRKLLLGAEQDSIAAITKRLDDGTIRAEEIAPLLPGIVRESSSHNTELVDALTPVLEKALRKSVHDDPAVTSEILYPILGPAIWTAVRSAFVGLMESLNTVVERSLSLESLRWRLEAFRTGRSFAEVALSHNLAYRVEQVFLIDSDAGLALLSTGSGPEGADSDLVSGMLTAIQDFVRDSFAAESGEYLNTVRMGDFLLCIERGPRAFLAAVVRGSAPTLELRGALRDNLELIHRYFGKALAESRGEPGAFDGCRPYLEACLREEFLPRPNRQPVLAYALVGLIALGALFWLGLGWLQDSRRNALIERLGTEPGIVVIEVSGRAALSLLRDPLAVDPAQLLGELGFDEADWVLESRPYISAESPIVLRRLASRLELPASVSLDVTDGIARASGVADPDWVERFTVMALQVPGVTEVDTVRLYAADGSALDGLVEQIEATTILFEPGEGIPSTPSQVLLSDLASRIRQLSSDARAAGLIPIVELRGNTDPSGSPEANLELSRRRAGWVNDALVEDGVSPFLLLQLADPAAPLSPENPIGQRSVTFQVHLDAPDDTGAIR